MVPLKQQPMAGVFRPYIKLKLTEWGNAMKNQMLVHKNVMITLLFLLGVFILVYFARVVVLPLALAFILCYLLLPVVNFLEKRHISTGISITIIYLVLVGILAAGVYWGIPKIITELADISKAIPSCFNDLQNYAIGIWEKIKGFLGISEVPPNIVAGIENFFASLGDEAANWARKSLRVIPSFFSNLLIVIVAPVMAYYLLRDRQEFMKRLNALMPPALREALLPLGRDVNSLLRNFMKGYVLVAILVGLSFYVLLLVLGVDYALTLGIIMAIAELIPYFGPFIAFVPSFFLVLLQGPGAILKLLLAWFVVQQLENLVISPKIMANSVFLHPLLVMSVVLVGGFWFGVLGLILAVPAAAACKLIGTWFYGMMVARQEALKNKEQL